MISAREAPHRLEGANPVPVSKSLPEGAWTPTALFEAVHERTRVPTALVSRPNPSETRQPTWSPWRGPMVAVAASIAVLLVGAIAFVLSGSDSPGEPTSSSPAIDVVEAFFERYEAGDVDGYESLMHPDAIWDCPECSEGPFFPESGARVLNRTWSHYLAATGMRREVECETSGSLVTCVATSTSALQPGTVVQVDEIEITVTEGAIVDVLVVNTTNGMLPATDLRGLIAYEGWLSENHSEIRDQLFGFRREPIMDTPEARDLHRQYVDRFLAETGGAPPVDKECASSFDFLLAPCVIPDP